MVCDRAPGLVDLGFNAAHRFAGICVNHHTFQVAAARSVSIFWRKRDLRNCDTGFMNINHALRTPAINAEHVLAEIRDELCEALKELDSLPELQAVAAELRTRTFEMGRVTDLTALIQRVIRGAREHHERVEREKELLLAQVGGSLDDITAFLSSEQADRTASTAESDTLNTVLTGAVEQIRLSFTHATKPAAIRDVVDVRLVAINAQLRTARANQEARARVSEERANRLGARVQELENETRRLQHDLAEKRRLALIDSLTGIANRAAYDERMQIEFPRWKRSRQPLSVLVWDLDRFKLINDTYGHKAGDKVLRALAQLFTRRIRECDFVARYGGEEFAMLLVGAHAEEAREFADQLRTEVSQLRFHFRETRVQVTASCGIATFIPGDTPRIAFNRADRALYSAKAMGRDRCILCASPLPGDDSTVALPEHPKRELR